MDFHNKGVLGREHSLIAIGTCETFRISYIADIK
jgi:hypothetical protein